MSIKVGDKIKFLNNVGGGIVKKIQDKKIAIILTEDDWEVPHLIKELIVVEEKTFVPPQNKSQQVVQDVPQEDDYEPEISESKDINIYLAFVPQKVSDPTNCDLDFYIINDSNYFIYYNILESEGKYFKGKNGELEPNTKYLLETKNRKNLNSLDNIHAQLMFFKKESFEIKTPHDNTIKINPVKFFKLKSFKENDFFDENSVIITVLEDEYHKVPKLTEDDIKRIIIEKEVNNKDTNQPITFKKNNNPANQEEVVDLHIHELIDDQSELKPKEIIDIQLNRFRTDIDSAIKRRIKSITFIHGMGNGSLKYELRRILDKEYKKYIYQDASFKEYGFGATMIMVR